MNTTNEPRQGLHTTIAADGLPIPTNVGTGINFWLPIPSKHFEHIIMNCHGVTLIILTEIITKI